MSPKLDHSAVVMTGASNWVVITYELPHKDRGCVGKCLGEDKAKPEVASIVLPLKHPSNFIDQAQRQQWMAGGLEKEYVERRDDIPYGDATHTMYSFNSKVQERKLASLEHGAHVQADQPLVKPPSFSRLQNAAAEHAEEYELEGLQVSS